MRGLLAVVLMIVLLFALGWLYVRNTGTTTEFVIDKEEIRSDTKAAVDEGKKLLDKAREGLSEWNEAPPGTGVAEESVPVEQNPGRAP